MLDRGLSCEGKRTSRQSRLARQLRAAPNRNRIGTNVTQVTNRDLYQIMSFRYYDIT